MTETDGGGAGGGGTLSREVGRGRGGPSEEPPGSHNHALARTPTRMPAPLAADSWPKPSNLASESAPEGRDCRSGAAAAGDLPYGAGAATPSAGPKRQSGSRCSTGRGALPDGVKLKARGGLGPVRSCWVRAACTAQPWPICPVQQRAPRAPPPPRAPSIGPRPAPRRSPVISRRRSREFGPGPCLPLAASFFGLCYCY